MCNSRSCCDCHFMLSTWFSQSHHEPISENNKIHVVDIFLHGSVDEKVFVISVQCKYLFICSLFNSAITDCLV